MGGGSVLCVLRWRNLSGIKRQRHVFGWTLGSSSEKKTKVGVQSTSMGDMCLCLMSYETEQLIVQLRGWMADTDRVGY